MIVDECYAYIAEEFAAQEGKRRIFSQHLSAITEFEPILGCPSLRMRSQIPLYEPPGLWEETAYYCVILCYEKYNC